MYSHITVGASKLTRAMRFYDAALAPLGLKRTRTFKIAASYAPKGFSGGATRAKAMTLAFENKATKDPVRSAGSR